MFPNPFRVLTRRQAAWPRCECVGRQYTRPSKAREVLGKKNGKHTMIFNAKCLTAKIPTTIFGRHCCNDYRLASPSCGCVVRSPAQHYTMELACRVSRLNQLMQSHVTVVNSRASQIITMYCANQQRPPYAPCLHHMRDSIWHFQNGRCYFARAPDGFKLSRDSM